MPDVFRPDEALRNQVIEQALAGDFLGARETTARMTTRPYLIDAWSAILAVQRDRGDIGGIKATIVSCPDPSFLHRMDNFDIPLHFARTGNRTAAIEIAETMGSFGRLQLLCLLTPLDLLKKGDYTGAKEVVARIADERIRSQIAHFVEEHQQQRTTSDEQAATVRHVEPLADPKAAQDHSKTDTTPPRSVP